MLNSTYNRFESLNDFLSTEQLLNDLLQFLPNDTIEEFIDTEITNYDLDDND